MERPTSGPGRRRERRPRIQGGWAPPPPTPPPESPGRGSGRSGRGRGGRGGGRGRPPRDGRSARARNAGASPSGAATAVTFWSSAATVGRTGRRQQRPLQVIHAEGDHEICGGPAEVGRIKFLPRFIPTEEADGLLEELSATIPFEARNIVIKGARVAQPRLVAWYGDFAYRYSGLTLAPSPWGSNPTLASLKTQVELCTGLQFNTALCNLYRDGHDSIAWHADDEDALGLDPAIASLSLGDARRFQLRRKSIPRTAECQCPRSAECGCAARPDYEIALASGSLLVMLEGVQAAFLHRVPKEYHDRTPRINITFRWVHPPA